jgi:PilZ domain
LKGTDRFVVDGVACAFQGTTASVANLSVGGLFAATGTPPPPGEMMEMDVAIKGRPPFRVLGKVAWINDADPKKAPNLPLGFGFKIVRIALPDKVALVDFLKRASPARLNRPAARR